ncbi:Uracil-DNA glycosylase [Gracilariopsis chorda]|uniref:Uracil-DNA glycosylase n=1 Tax=Gracilariopsis chorda TaxID=448386 RepID=A0A2V3IKZ7_9FLOR|nr:Uracil-DNA glycosylase [Gracilariopsis chorda]|eukprot:PXF41810.1 Uracil-DNA glycosylase [Gracilariopsis chorda]
MQSSITSFFKKTPATSVNKQSKRATALSPTQAKLLKEETLPADVKARIAANRAAARAKLLARTMKNMNGKADFGAALEPSWREALADTLKEPFWKTLSDFVATERRAHTVYPPPDKVFSAFNHSSFIRTRVVIIGQDPYHGPGQAHGMCFSVLAGVYSPPSLQNIFSELENDIPGFKKPRSGCLEKWANQGVLLLNSVLTVQRAQPNSHKGRGWERFTDAVVDALNKRPGPGLVFMLWGGYAKKKGASINAKKHCVLKAVHPSPLSANSGGWFGNKHFSQANAFLKKSKQDPIDWRL